VLLQDFCENIVGNKYEYPGVANSDSATIAAIYHFKSPLHEYAVLYIHTSQVFPVLRLLSVHYDRLSRRQYIQYV
jgi:hypothetical protein